MDLTDAIKGKAVKPLNKEEMLEMALEADWDFIDDKFIGDIDGYEFHLTRDGDSFGIQAYVGDAPAGKIKGKHKGFKKVYNHVEQEIWDDAIGRLHRIADKKVQDRNLKFHTLDEAIAFALTGKDWVPSKGDEWDRFSSIIGGMSVYVRHKVRSGKGYQLDIYPEKKPNIFKSSDLFNTNDPEVKSLYDNIFMMYHEKHFKTIDKRIKKKHELNSGLKEVTLAEVLLFAKTSDEWTKTQSDEWERYHTVIDGLNVTIRNKRESYTVQLDLYSTENPDIFKKGELFNICNKEKELMKIFNFAKDHSYTDAKTKVRNKVNGR